MAVLHATYAAAYFVTASKLQLTQQAKPVLGSCSFFRSDHGQYPSGLYQLPFQITKS